MFWAIAAPRIYSDAHICGDAHLGDYAVITRNANSTPACPAALR